MQPQGLFQFPLENKPPVPMKPEREFAFSVERHCVEIPRRLILEHTNQATGKQIGTWRADPTAGGDTEIAMNCGYRGFQIASVDSCGRLHLEGIVLYSRKRHGMYLRALETAPWNRSRRKFSGIATVLVARLAQESDRIGLGGIIFAIPTSAATEDFNRKLGFIYFRQYAMKHNLARDAFPLGYEYSMVLDRSGAKKFIADQLERRGNLKIETHISASTIPM